MAAPTVSARSSSQTTSNSTSHVVTLPSHSAGELLVVAIATDGQPTITAPGGWTLVRQQQSGTSDGRAAIIAKVAASGSETLTYTTSASEQTAELSWAISGHGVASAADLVALSTATSGDVSTATNATSTVSGLSATVDYLCLLAHAAESTATSRIPTAAPSGFTQFRTNSIADNITCGNASAAERGYSGVTSIAPGAWVRVATTTRSFASITLAIPGAGASTPQGDFAGDYTFGAGGFVGQRAYVGGFAGTYTWGAGVASGDVDKYGGFAGTYTWGAGEFSGEADASGAFAGTYTFGPGNTGNGAQFSYGWDLDAAGFFPEEPGVGTVDFGYATALSAAGKTRINSAILFNYNWDLDTAGHRASEGGISFGFSFGISSEGNVKHSGSAAFEHAWDLDAHGKNPPGWSPVAFSYDWAVQSQGRYQPQGTSGLSYVWGLSAQGFMTPELETTLEDSIADLEWQWFTANSGLTPIRRYSLADHKRAYWMNALSLATSELSNDDLELEFYKDALIDTSDRTLTDLKYDYFSNLSGKTPRLEFSMADHMKTYYLGELTP